MSEVKSEEKLQNALVSTFLANLAFLREYDKNLFIKVDELSKMINEGIYKEKYRLEFIKENGDFDMYDLVNEKYVYDRKPKEWNDKVLKKINLDDKDTILTLEREVYIKNPPFINTNTKYELQNAEDSNLLVLNDISKYTKILDDELKNKKRLKKISKFIFLGTLLGRHISRISNKIDADLYLVCEKNLEIFRLSLFTTDYSILTKKVGVIFSIMDNEKDFINKLTQFISINPFDNYMIKLSSTGLNIQTYIDEILSYIVSNKPTMFDYNRHLYIIMRNISNRLNSEYNTLLINKLQNNINIFDNIPVLYIGGGPSLDDNLEWIKENQNKFFIVTVGAAFKKLLDNKIKIDMLFSLDSKYTDIGDKQFSEENCKLLKNTIVICSIMTHEKILNRLNPNTLFLYEIFNCFHKDNLVSHGLSVGEIGLGLLLNMNVKKMYFIGIDMALNKYTGSTHSLGSTSDSTQYDIEEIKTKQNNKREVFGLRTGLLKVKGNLESEVVTSSVFKASIECINDILYNKNGIEIYNLSEHGAFFDNTIAVRNKDIDTKNLKEFIVDYDKLITVLQNNSVNTLENDSKHFILEEIKYIEEFISDDFNIFKNTKILKYAQFSIETKNLFLKITQYKSNQQLLSMIFTNYSKILFNYLEYHFNDIKVKNEAKKIEKIRTVFIEQFELMINDYLKYLKKLVK